MKISVVCPFFNEAGIIEKSLRLMLENLEALQGEWELIVVDDGSTDDSRAKAERVAAEHPRLMVLGYPQNRGRGFAIRTGAVAARGSLLVTTEIDSSWGDDIVARLVSALDADPSLEMVIASPHLPGGGYRNVPKGRVLISSWGNLLLRVTTSRSISMFTGMTRGYRRERFLELPLDEPEKEMHVEVVHKALAYGYRIGEIPALLEWKTHKLEEKPATGQKRRSAFKLGKLVRTHLSLGFASAPYRLLLIGSAGLLGLAAVFIGLAVVNLFRPAPSAFYLLTGMLLSLISGMTLGIALLSMQLSKLQYDVWRVRSDQRRSAEAQSEKQRSSDGP